MLWQWARLEGWYSFSSCPPTCLAETNRCSYSACLSTSCLGPVLCQSRAGFVVITSCWHTTCVTLVLTLQLHLFQVAEVHSSRISSLCWSANTERLFSGDATGNIICTEIDYTKVCVATVVFTVYLVCITLQKFDSLIVNYS